VTTPDVGAGNEAQRDAWDGETGAFWADHIDRFEAVGAAHGRAFLEAAAVRPGETVLDVGCGAGHTTLDLAPGAAPGPVTGVDLSTRLLAIARARAAVAGHDTVTFVHADAQVHPFPAAATDLVVSRHGTMFFADPAAAFANLARALRPGGRMVLLTWRGIEHQEWLRTFRTVLAAGREVTFPPPHGPSPLSLSDPDRVRALLEAAGFADVELDAHRAPMVFGADPDDALGYVAGMQSGLLDDLDPAARDDALAALRADLVGHHDGAHGVRYDSATWIVRARRA
jgi:SAM-dependent methyltransferase